MSQIELGLLQAEVPVEERQQLQSQEQQQHHHQQQQYADDGGTESDKLLTQRSHGHGISGGSSHGEDDTGSINAAFALLRSSFSSRAVGSDEESLSAAPLWVRCGSCLVLERSAADYLSVSEGEGEGEGGVPNDLAQRPGCSPLADE